MDSLPPHWYRTRCQLPHVLVSVMCPLKGAVISVAIGVLHAEAQASVVSQADWHPVLRAAFVHSQEHQAPFSCFGTHSLPPRGWALVFETLNSDDQIAEEVRIACAVVQWAFFCFVFCT